MAKNVMITPNHFAIKQHCVRFLHGGFWGDETEEGCWEDLTETILEAWDGTNQPFTITCPGCGRKWKFVVTLEASATGILVR